MPALATTEHTLWHAPQHVVLERDGLYVLLDPQTPNWIACDARGARLVSWLDGHLTLNSLATRYAAEFGVDNAKAWLHVDRFVHEAARHGFAAPEPFLAATYPGRARYLEARLRELWIHTNNSCNLACEHCLVSAGPDGERGLERAALLALIDEAAELGVRQFYFTGGEPFMRRDLFELIERVTHVHGRALRILTNGLLFQGAVLEALRACDPRLLTLQVSLDGATAATNDALRGAGTFAPIVAGLRTLSEAGFAPTLATVVTHENHDQLEALVRLAHETGAAGLHCLWAHKKGRWANQEAVPPATLVAALRRAHAAAARLGVTIDNVSAFRARVNGLPGTRVDLSNMGVESACVYSDGRVFPSAATAQYEALELGRWRPGNLRALLEDAPVARHLRTLSVEHKPVCGTCKFKFVCGGGDLEHAYSYARDHVNGRTAFDALDPYCDLYQALIGDRMFEFAAEGRRAQRTVTGYAAPVVYHAMGAGNPACAPGADTSTLGSVHTSHSNCVAPADPQRPRGLVQEFYARAAETPQAALCCPVDYDAADTAHIPAEVIERFYGCGGPMSVAAVQPGETVVDLGSGAGIDVFIAAKKVGPTGRAIGVDMTDPMLGVAGQNRARVAQALGYDVAEFHKGFLEDVPLPDRVANLVTSNCVINLSADKPKVLREMWRVLADHGRVVLADIVADRPLPRDLTVNAHLWGECVSGALPEERFMAELERAGFYGLTVLKKTFWKRVQGYDFFSVTVRGFKFEKKAGCVFLGQRAVYLGPYVAIVDEEGHHFPRGQAVEVCTDTAAKLAQAPYKGSFALLEPDGTRVAFESPGGDVGACGPDCC
jgi:radical SAM protein with 4Fe4S-binding SPASM domain